VLRTGDELRIGETELRYEGASVRVVDYAIATHAGRVRRRKDAYYAEPPLLPLQMAWVGRSRATGLAHRRAGAGVVEEGSAEGAWPRRYA
jgi:hypothetical protein